MSILERFRNRQNRAMQLPVSYPADKPELEFLVRRLPQTILNNAIIKASGDLAAMHVEAGTDGYRISAYLWTCFHLVPYLKSHVISWRAMDGSAFQTFTPKAFDDLIEDFSIPELQALGMAYMNAHDDDEKKTTPETSTAPAS